MADRRKLSRREMTRRRATEINDARAKASANCERAARTLQLAKTLLGGNEFAELARAHGIRSLPAFLTKDSGYRLTSDPTSNNKRRDDVTLEFIVVWRFLFSLLEKPAIADHFDAVWPGFIMEFKDTFIALSVDGPFPNATSGLPHH